MLKKLFLSVLVCVSGLAYGQHLARVCVVDLARVYQESSRDSQAVREFEQNSARVQEEINRRQGQINELLVRHSTAVSGGDQNEATRLETQIRQLRDALNQYYNAQMAILQSQRENLMQSSTFLNQVNDAVRLVAEGEGYSIVIDKSNRNTGVLWASAMVDITDKVIQHIRSRAR